MGMAKSVWRCKASSKCWTEHRPMSAAKRTVRGDPALEKAARAHGIQTSYIDNVGRKQFASPEALRLILERLGAEASTEQPRMIEPVAVHWQKSKSQIKVRLPAEDL